MRPIILNLLAEEQFAEQASVHDPVRATAVCAAGLLLVVGLVGAGVNWWADGLKSKAAALQKKNTEQSTAPGDEGPGDLRLWRGFATDALNMNQSRSPMAPQLALLKDLIPDTIRLSQFTFVVTAESSPVGPSIQPGDLGGGKGRRGPVTPSTERITLRLEGQAECPRPEVEVDEFIKRVKEYPALKDQIQEVKLRSINRDLPPSGDPATPVVPTARFVIECLYREKR
jgi:hypothetical protein